MGTLGIFFFIDCLIYRNLKDGSNISRKINELFANIRILKTILSDFLMENLNSGLMHSFFR